MVTVSGQNFGRLEPLDIRLGDQPATRAQADEEGRFTVRFQVPQNARPGTNTIVAASGNPGGSTASTEFVVGQSP